MPQRPRVAALEHTVRAGLRAGKVAVEMQVDRAGQVARVPARLAGGQLGAQAVCRYEGVEGGRHGRVQLSSGALAVSPGTAWLRSSVAHRPAPTINSMPASAIQVMRSANSSTP